jgi:hypothetical protein
VRRLFVITFKCQTCGRVIRVAPEHAGRKGRCPGCKEVISVPRPDLIALEKPKPVPQTDTAADDEVLAQFALSHGQVSRYSEPEEKSVRRLPWLLDIFAYPFSISGIANLCIFWFVPIALSLIPPIGLLGLALFVAQVIVAGYMYYYLLDCIRDSAAGGIRAPENVGSQPGGMDAMGAMWQVVVSFVLFWGPFIGYMLYAYNVRESSPNTRTPDLLSSPVFWCTLIYGIALFPAGVLSVAMMELSEAVKPWIWFKAIFKAPFEYCMLILGCLFVATLVFLTSLLTQYLPVLGLLVRGVVICLAMTMAHLIGRFYFRNSRKISWDI